MTFSFGFVDAGTYTEEYAKCHLIRWTRTIAVAKAGLPFPSIHDLSNDAAGDE